MIADVVFDAPLDRAFSYRVPATMPLAPGQRVLAPLGGARRVGLVIALRGGDDGTLKPLQRVVDRVPLLEARGLALARWIAAESLSSLGSTCLSLLSPAEPTVADPAAIGRRGTPTEGADGHPGPGDCRAAGRTAMTLLAGAGRERRMLERLAAAEGPALVIVPDAEAAARWAPRLARLGTVARLDSGVSDGERAEAWSRLQRGAARVAIGMRSALLAPLAEGSAIALVDEHDLAHRPPGPPRVHAREVVCERAARESLVGVLTSATPSVETWWRATDHRSVTLDTVTRAAWPAVTMADTRRILRREPLTPPLARALREALAARRRALLVVSRFASALACEECGEIVRCPRCALAMTYARTAATLACRLCAASVPLMDTCATCQGRRLSPFGWGAERVEHAVRRRFPGARVARYEPDARRGARGRVQRAAAAEADVVIGTRGALRLFGPASLGLAGFVAPDQLLRLPDFRAGERLLALLWAAAERTVADGALVIQSQHPTHYVFDALARQDLTAFYRPELKFRAELGYPPFRRLAIVTVRGPRPPEVARLAEGVGAALRGAPDLTVYPAAADRRGRAQRIVVKGGPALPQVLATALGDFARARARGRGMMDVEVDPVEWPS